MSAAVHLYTLAECHAAQHCLAIPAQMRAALSFAAQSLAAAPQMRCLVCDHPTGGQVAYVALLLGEACCGHLQAVWHGGICLDCAVTHEREAVHRHAAGHALLSLGTVAGSA